MRALRRSGFVVAALLVAVAADVDGLMVDDPTTLTTKAPTRDALR